MDVHNRETLMLKHLKISHINTSKFRTSGFLVGKPFCVCFDQLKAIDFTSRNNICKNTPCDAKSHDFNKIGQLFKWHKMIQISDIHVMKWENKDNEAQDFSSNFTENSNGARHVSIIVDSQPCIKSINKHKSHPVPPPRQQNVNEDYQDNSMIGCSIRVDPDMTLRDLLGAVTRSNQKPKVINEVSSEAALRKALEGEGDDEEDVELKLTLNGTSVSLEPAKSCKNTVDAPICLKKFLPGSTLQLTNTSEKGHLTKTAKTTKTIPTTFRKKQSVQCKPILKKSSNPIHKTSIKSLKTSKNSSLSSLSCYSSEFSLESEPALSKGYPKYLVLSRRARGKTTDSPLSTDNSQFSSKKFPENHSGRKTANASTIERNTACDIKNLLPALTKETTYSQLYQLKKLLDHQRQQEQEEIHKFYPIKKKPHKESETKRSTGKEVIKPGPETQKAFSCLSPSLLNPLSTKFKTTNMWNSGCISDKSLTSMESSLNSCGDEKSIEAVKSQTEKSDLSRNKRPAPPPPPYISSHGLTKTVSVPSQQCKEKPSQDTAKQFSWEYFESNAFKRPAPPPPPRKPFLSDLLSGERLGGRLYSSKGLHILRSTTEAHPLSDIPIAYSGSTQFDEDPTTIECPKAEVYSVRKKRLAPLPPPRLTNNDIGSQICSTVQTILQSPINDNRKDKPRVSFADGEGVLDEQWRQAMQEFNLSYHYKEQSNNSARKEKFESSLGNKACQTRPHVNTTSESCALLSDAQTYGKLPESLSHIATDNHSSSPTNSHQVSRQSNNAEEKLDGVKNFFSKDDKSEGDKSKQTDFSERFVNSTRTNMTFEEYIIQSKSPKAKTRLNIHNTSFPNSSVITPNNHPSDYSKTQNTMSPTKPTLESKKADQNKSRDEFENKGPSPRLRHPEFKLAALKPCRPITNLLPLTKQDDSKHCEIFNRSQNNAKLDPKLQAGTLCKDTKMHDKRTMDSPSKQVQFRQEVTAFVNDPHQGSDYSFQSVVSRHDHHTDSHSRFVSVDDDRSPGVELTKLLEESHSHEINSRFTSLSPSLSTSVIARAVGSALSISESFAQSRESISIRNEINQRIDNQQHYASNYEPAGNSEYFYGRFQKERNNLEPPNSRSFESETSVIHSCSEPYQSESSCTLATSVDSEIDQIPFIEVLKPEKPNRFSYVRDLHEARFNQLHDFMPLDIVDEKHKLADLSNLMKTKQTKLQRKFTDASKTSKVSNHMAEESNQRFSPKIPSKSRGLFSSNLSKLRLDSHRVTPVNSRFSSVDDGICDWLSFNCNNNCEEQNTLSAQYDISSNIQYEVARELDERNAVQNLSTDSTIELDNSCIMNKQKCDETETLTVFIDPDLDDQLSDYESEYFQRIHLPNTSDPFEDINAIFDESTEYQEDNSRKSEVISSFRNQLCNYESIRNKKDVLSNEHFAENTSNVKLAVNSAGYLETSTSKCDQNWIIPLNNSKNVLTYPDNDKVLNQKDNSEIYKTYNSSINNIAHTSESLSNPNKVVMSLVCQSADNSNSFKVRPGAYNEPSISNNNLHLIKNQCFEKSEGCDCKENIRFQSKNFENVGIETITENPADAQMFINSARPASTMTRFLQTLSKRYPKAISSRCKIGTTINLKNDTDALNKKVATDKQKFSKSSLFQGYSRNKHQSTSDYSMKTGIIKPVKKSGKQTLNIFADQSVLFSRFKSKHGARKNPVTRRSPAFLQKDSYSPDISRFSPPPSEYSSHSETFQPPESDPQMRFSELVVSDPPRLATSSALSAEVLTIEDHLRMNGKNQLGNGLVTLPTSTSLFCENSSLSCSTLNRPITPPRKSDIVLSVSYNRSDLENHPNFLKRQKINSFSSIVKLTGSSDEIVPPSEEVTPGNEDPKIENNIKMSEVWKDRHESSGLPEEMSASSTKTDLFKCPEVKHKFDLETRDLSKYLCKISSKNHSHSQRNTEEIKKVNKGCHSISSSSTRARETFFIDPSNPETGAFPNVTFNPSSHPLIENKSKFHKLMPNPESNFEEKNSDINEFGEPSLDASNLSETSAVGLTKLDNELEFQTDFEKRERLDKLNCKQISEDEMFEGFVNLLPSKMISSEAFLNDTGGHVCRVSGSNIVKSSDVLNETSSGLRLDHEFKTNQSNNLTNKSHTIDAKFCSNEGMGIIRFGNKNKQISPDICDCAVIDTDIPSFVGTNLLIRKCDSDEGLLKQKCHVKRDENCSLVKLKKSLVDSEMENDQTHFEIKDVVNVFSNKSSEEALISIQESVVSVNKLQRSSRDQMNANNDINKMICMYSAIANNSDCDQKHLSSLFSKSDFMNANYDHVTPQDMLENHQVSLSTLSTNSTLSSDSSGSFVVSCQNMNQKRVPGKFLVRNSIEVSNALINSRCKDSISSDKIKPISVGRFDRRSYLPDGSCVSVLSNKENFHEENHFQDSRKWEFGGVAKTLEDLYMSPLEMPFDSTG